VSFDDRAREVLRALIGAWTAALKGEAPDTVIHLAQSRDELEDAMSTPSMEDLERACKLVRAFTLAAQAYLTGERAEMVRNLDLAVRELAEHPAFAADNGDILRGIAELLQKADLDRAQLGEGFDEEVQALRARVAALEAQHRGAKRVQSSARRAHAPGGGMARRGGPRFTKKIAAEVKSMRKLSRSL
jgi:hypothetical protein